MLPVFKRVGEVLGLGDGIFEKVDNVLISISSLSEINDVDAVHGHASLSRQHVAGM